MIIVVALAYPKLVNGIDESKLDQDLERSIAVLPFINDSNDPTNVHIINGLMESILNNLQKIEDLKVVSRTSVEKYRNSKKTISEIAKELNVNYFIEGSGQKIGDRIQLNVQLIEAPTDNHLWAEQYNRDATDIFELQSEVAKNIAGRIEAIITPEEEERIDKVPTDNLVAYDHFLKGLDLLYQRKRESLEEAIIYFKKAIAEDKDFAHAYAYIAIAYYYLDIAQTEKKYSIEISDNADKALLLDQQLTQSLVAKALFYMHSAEYELAVPYFEKALEYNPNSAWVINLLSDFYTSYIPNTQKYLEYALRGIKLDIASNDSITTSFIYLHVSNAFIQTGFVDEAEKYINRSLTYDHDNLYSEYVKAYILYVKNRDLLKIKERLIKALNKDRSRLDIIQEVGKICYFMRDYEEAYVYYKKFIEMKEAQNLDIYRGENAKIAMVMSKIGMKEEAEIYISDFKEYADNNRSIYKHLSMAMYHSYRDDTAKAIDHLELFLKEDNYHYWIILFLKIDPLTDNIKELPEFKRIFEEIEKKFWKDHEQIKISLEEKDLL